MFRRPGVEIAFQDATGLSWVRTAMGELSEIPESTAAHYDIGLPARWQMLLTELPSEEEMQAMLEEELRKWREENPDLAQDEGK
jgi:hypothetical protein